MFSAEDEFSLDFHVDTIPHGFKLIQSNDGGGYFFCTSCDMPVEP